jgi:hypothetical protein
MVDNRFRLDDYHGILFFFHSSNMLPMLLFTHKPL